MRPDKGEEGPDCIEHTHACEAGSIHDEKNDKCHFLVLMTDVQRACLFLAGRI